MRIRKAFTLIELLVVIAIIAILAAILFPVFAQAKAAAKKAAATSNLKQNALAVIMYADSNEDVYPQAAYVGLKGTVQSLYSAYDVILPFSKSKELFQDPGEPDAIKWRDIVLTAYKSEMASPVVASPENFISMGTSFNFALITLSKYNSLTPNPVVSASQVSLPSDTVLFYSADYNRKNANAKYLDKYPATTVFKGDVKYTKPTTDFSRYNFVGSPRHSNNLVVNFADSSVKAKSGSAKLIGQGTDQNSAAATLIDCYNLPYDLNGIPESIAEPYNAK